MSRSEGRAAPAAGVLRRGVGRPRRRRLRLPPRYRPAQRRDRWSPPDEHAIPTLLAVKGLSNETACDGAVTRAWWDGERWCWPAGQGGGWVGGQYGGLAGGRARGWGRAVQICAPDPAALRYPTLQPRAPKTPAYCRTGPYFHPHTYDAREATRETLAKLRGDGCALAQGLDPRAALQRAAATVAAAGTAGNRTSRTAAVASEQDAGLGLEKAAATEGGRGGGSDGVWAAALAEAGAPLLLPRCPLFARKMASEAVQEWSGMLRAEGAVR